MWNIMKSQIYQLKRDILFYAAILLAFVVTFIVNLEAFEQGMTGSEGMAYMGSSMTTLFGMLPILVIVAITMGKDFVDKTINYEILSGHTRKEVFFGRLIVGTIPGVFFSLLVMVIIPITLTAMNGWGNTMELKGVILRYVLVFITLFRISFEITFLTTLTKNHYLTLVLAYLFGMVQMFLFTAQSFFSDFKVTPLLPVANCLNLLTFDDWSTFYLDEVDQILYSSTVTSEMVLWAVIPSIVIGAMIVLLSYVFFQHDDLN